VTGYVIAEILLYYPAMQHKTSIIGPEKMPKGGRPMVRIVCEDAPCVARRRLERRCAGLPFRLLRRELS